MLVARWYMKYVHLLMKWPIFSVVFWMKHHLSLLDYGASVRKCSKGFCSWNYTATEKSIESQVPPVFMYGRRHVFIFFPYFLTSNNASVTLGRSWGHGVEGVNNVSTTQDELVKLTSLRNLCNFCWGCKICLTASTFTSRGQILCFSTWCPRNSSDAAPSTHLAGLITMPLASKMAANQTRASNLQTYSSVGVGYSKEALDRARPH